MEEDINLVRKSRQYIDEIVSLSEKDIEKIERVCSALERQFNAEASKEAHQKFRVLFERAAKEWLPFIIYCLTFGTVAATAIYFISKLTGWWLVVSWVGLIIVMMVPVLSAPFLHKNKNLQGEKK